MRVALAILLFPLVSLAQDNPWSDEEWDDEPAGLTWNGFIEGALGSRLDSDIATGTNSTLLDFRVRIETQWQPGRATMGFKADVGYDGIEHDVIGEVRDLTVAFVLGKRTDVRLGRQVQTWGTGDLVFLNDLFPKDFVSFFSGRDDEYLKAPGDAIRITHYTSSWNIDAVWTPVFEPDVYLTGERFSFFDPGAGRNVAPSPPLRALVPDNSIDNGEFALRLFRTSKGREYAVYGYSGFSKQPGARTAEGRATFAPLSALGASLRQPAGPGLFNAEFAFHASRDDRAGTNPQVPNDQLRLLAGYEWEPMPNFTVGLQYYVEHTLDYDELIANSPFPTFEPERFRHVVTNRLTWRTGRDRHMLSLFTFWSPSDRDFYLRPRYSFRYSDYWSLDVGLNLFGGDLSHTFFSQLRDASNAYVRLRFHY